MSGAAGEEYANLYMRGVNQGASGVELEAQDVLDLLGVFGTDGVRWYLIGILEGIEDEAEREIEKAPRDLSTEVDLHVVDDEDEILKGGRVVAVEFKNDAEEDRGEIRGDPEPTEAGPAVVTVEKWKYEIIEYAESADWPKD